MRLTLVFLTFLFCNPLWATAAVCAGTYQSFWKIDPDKKTLNRVSFYKHPETIFCEKSVTHDANAEIVLLDKSKKIIRSRSAYISLDKFSDVKNGQRISAGFKKEVAQTVQIKFASDEEFKKAKFLKITFSDGKIYGPASF